MMRSLFLIIFFFSTFDVVFSQEGATLRTVRENYESFEYRNVITLSEQLLQTKDSLTNDALLDLYTMKAVAHFSLAEETNARRTFFDILNLKKDFALDTITISPKIISFFGKVKTEFLQITEHETEAKTVKQDSVTNGRPFILLPRNDVVQNVIIRSIVLPGWGHLYTKESTKGFILTSASILSLGAGIYFTIDANDKESSYLGETNSALIQKKYNTYNTSYKMRNIFLVSYAVIWTYTQLDVLFFSTDVLNAGVASPISAVISPTTPISLSFSITIR